MKKTNLYNLTNHDSVIAISGVDAATFTQGQVTCDIDVLTEQNSLFGAFCNPKGRVISLFNIFKRLNIYYLIVPTGLSDVLIKRLKMFIFRSKVDIQDVSENFCLFGLSSTSFISNAESFAKFNITESANNSILLITKNQQEQFTQSEDIVILDDTAKWDIDLIVAGIPRVTDKTTELFIPQPLNLDALGAISFTKGCYTGQEIVARLHYKGSSKRRTCIFKSSVMVAPGTDLFVSGENNSIATILNIQKQNSHHYCGTVVIKTNYLIKHTINCDGIGKIELNPVPYPIQVPN
jgi:hypothetical protein